jgi:hypothetical protein
MFSTFIPMYLTMKQAESIYDRDMLEAKRLDARGARYNLN